MHSAATTLRSIALEYPAAIRVFERYHLDYCCGGRRPLAEACAEKDLDASGVLAEIAALGADAQAPQRDFTQATARELIAHIVQTHHNFVRSELTRLLPLAVKVARQHGPAHPEYVQVEAKFRALGDELTNHLAKEEAVLFP